MNGKSWLLNEPSIEDILRDPIIRLLMRRDGVSEDALRDALLQPAQSDRPCAQRPSRVA